MVFRFGLPSTHHTPHHHTLFCCCVLYVWIAASQRLVYVKKIDGLLSYSRSIFEQHFRQYWFSKKIIKFYPKMNLEGEISPRLISRSYININSRIIFVKKAFIIFSSININSRIIFVREKKHL